MKVNSTNLSQVFIIEPAIFSDHRGYFFESYNKAKFEKATGIKIDFIQDNESNSSYGVLRGLHYQISPYAQAKLVRVTDGVIQDVIVDMRQHSPTYGQHLSIILSSENKKQLFVPRGFAHGFAVLSDRVTLQYKCDNLYVPEAERSLSYNDKELAIEWKVSKKDIILSKKDQQASSFKSAENNFYF